MTINEGNRFIYANQVSDEFGVQMASSFGSTSRSGNSENRNIVTTHNTYTNTFSLHKVGYDNPLEFDLILFNADESFIDANKERSLKKWLMKDDYNWLQIDQDDMNNIYYRCISTKAEMLDVGTYSGGLLISFQCADPWAWSGIYKKEYVSSTTLNFNMFMDIDFDKYVVYPTIQIKCLSDGDIIIQNVTTNETIEVSDCITGEEIIIECDTDKISSTNPNIISRWNKGTVSLGEGKNSFLLTGNFEMTMSYRLPIRVGA